MNLRDAAERIAWTAVSAILSAILSVLPALVLSAPDWLAPVIFPVLTAAINWASLWVRTKLGALPSPGEGLPGLPTTPGQ